VRAPRLMGSVADESRNGGKKRAQRECHARSSLEGKGDSLSPYDFGTQGKRAHSPLEVRRRQAKPTRSGGVQSDPNALHVLVVLL
jgi:hypothetical protein